MWLISSVISLLKNLKTLYLLTNCTKTRTGIYLETHETDKTRKKNRHCLKILLRKDDPKNFTKFTKRNPLFGNSLTGYGS